MYVNSLFYNYNNKNDNIIYIDKAKKEKHCHSLIIVFLLFLSEKFNLENHSICLNEKKTINNKGKL